MKFVRQHILFLFLLFLVILFAGCGHKDQEVVAVEETRSYHLAQCAKVAMAKTVAISRAEAERRQLHPCPYCNPDKAL